MAAGLEGITETSSMSTFLRTLCRCIMLVCYACAWYLSGLSHLLLTRPVEETDR